MKQHFPEFKREDNLGRFLFDKIIRFEFLEVFTDEWTSIFLNFRQRPTLRGIPKFSEISLQEFPFQRFAFRKFFDFLETFPGNFHTNCPHFRIIKTLVERKALLARLIQIFETFSNLEFLFHSMFLSEFSEFLAEWKAPKVKCSTDVELTKTPL